MALTQTQILWSSASSKSLNSTSRFDSDPVTVAAGEIVHKLQIRADNSGTPASGDTVDVYIVLTTGDILGDSGDDYGTAEHAVWVAKLDTYGTNTPGEDPADTTIDITNVVRGAKGYKISAVAAQGGTRAITFYARISVET